MKTPVESLLYIVIASFIGSFGAVYLKVGANRIKRGLRDVLFNPALATGVALFLLSSYFFVLGLRRGELSVLYPLVSLSYIWAQLWSRIFFKEPFTPRKLCALALIVVGIVFVGIGNR